MGLLVINLSPAHYEPAKHAYTWPWRLYRASSGGTSLEADISDEIPAHSANYITLIDNNLQSFQNPTPVRHEIVAEWRQADMRITLIDNDLLKLSKPSSWHGIVAEANRKWGLPKPLI